MSTSVSRSGSSVPGAASTRRVRTASRELRRASAGRTRHLQVLVPARLRRGHCRGISRNVPRKRLAGRRLGWRVDAAPHGRRTLCRQHDGCTCRDNRNEPEDAAGSVDRQDEGNRTTTASSRWSRVHRLCNDPAPERPRFPCAAIRCTRAIEEKGISNPSEAMRARGERLPWTQ